MNPKINPPEIIRFHKPKGKTSQAKNKDSADIARLTPIQYAKILTVLEEKRSMAASLWKAFTFILRNPLGVVLLQLFLLLPWMGLFYLSRLVDSLIKPDSWPLICSAFLVSFLLLFLKLFIRLSFYSCQMEFLRKRRKKKLSSLRSQLE